MTTVLIVFEINILEFPETLSESILYEKISIISLNNKVLDIIKNYLFQPIFYRHSFCLSVVGRRNSSFKIVFYIAHLAQSIIFSE